jgi:predicted ATPase/class 3 adenylate cyclase
MIETFGRPAPASPDRKSTLRGGERRQVTALFYDIVGSTTLLNSLDPEDFGVIQRRVHSETAAVLHKHGGYLDRVLGDGGCAYFGYPAPTEDAAEAAVSAALEIVERCRSLEATEAIPHLGVRVGVATGLAVLNSTEGTVLPGTVEIIGIAPNLAARLQAEAEPNTVIVSDTTHHLTAPSFDYDLAGVRDLKGFTEPQRLWRPLAKRAVHNRFSAMRRPDSPLVGREEELDLCRRRWTLASKGRGQVVFIVGEPGIGKSRLVAEIVREASLGDSDAHVYQCQPRGNTRPLHAFLDRIRRDIGSFLPRGAKPDRQALRDYILLTAHGISEASADIISFLLEADPDARNGRETFAELPVAEFRQRAVAAFIEVLSSWSRGRPQVIALEDLHWADTLTQLLLSRLLDEVRCLRVLLLVTTREPAAADLLGDPHTAVLALPRLDAAVVPQVVDAVWEPSRPPAGLAAFIEEKSDGVPLFVEELAHLLKNRVDQTSSGPAEWDAILAKGGIATLADLLSARMADLGQGRTVAQVASVIGREFSYELFASLLGGEMPDISPDAQLEALVKAGVLRRRLGERLSFRFRHVLLQEAAYDSLLKAKRRELHARIVDLVHDKAVDQLPDEIMAWHCEQAGRMVEAARYAIRAAEACAVRSATPEANRLLKRAEGYLTSSSSAPEVDELTLQLLAARGPIAIEMFGKGSTDACAIYEKGVAICRERGVQDRERWFPLYWGWWFTSPDRNTKRTRSQVLIDDLDRANDPEIRLQALHCAWAANFHGGNHQHCLSCIEKGLALYDPERARVSRTRYGGHDARVCALGERAQLLWLTGKREDAAESIGDALTWAEEISHVGSSYHALDNAILLRSYERNFAEVIRLSERMREIAEAQSNPGPQAKAKIFGGWARALSGRLEDGFREFEEGLDRHRAIGTDEDMPVYLDMRAQLLQQRGEFASALEVLDEAVKQAEATGNLVWLPELYRRRALFRHARDRDAETCRQELERACSLAERQGAVALAGRARQDLAQLDAGPLVEQQ